MFRYRPARPQDLARCVLQARDAFAYNPQDHNDIQAMWIDLLTAGSTVSMVIEECVSGRIAFFVVTAFVNDAFAAQLANADVPPLTSGYWLEAWRAGRLPVLTREQASVANSTTGVTLFCIASGVATDIVEAGQMPFLLSKINDCHPFAFAGYRMNAIYVELYDEMTRAWGDTFGYDRLTDFTAWYEQNGGVPSIYDDKHPYLYGIAKPKALRKFGSMVTTFFYYTPPCFGFTPPEQELLLWALGGDKDDYLSDRLCIAPVTVRKRWDAIYRRVADVQPDFLGAAKEGGKRGTEKKGRLLAYLEHHMEELRPHRWPVVLR